MGEGGHKIKSLNYGTSDISLNHLSPYKNSRTPITKIVPHTGKTPQTQPSRERGETRGGTESGEERFAKARDLSLQHVFCQAHPPSSVPRLLKQRTQGGLSTDGNAPGGNPQRQPAARCPRAPDTGRGAGRRRSEQPGPARARAPASPPWGRHGAPATARPLRGLPRRPPNRPAALASEESPRGSRGRRSSTGTEGPEGPTRPAGAHAQHAHAGARAHAHAHAAPSSVPRAPARS